jgi:hypothetical protein
MNPDLKNKDKIIHDLLKKNGIPVPESRIIKVNEYDPDTAEDTRILPYEQHRYYDEWYPIYSTDEAFRILPDEIIVYIGCKGNVKKTYRFRAHKKHCWYYDKDYPEFCLGYSQKSGKDINQALKQLLIWALENYPEQVKEHLNKMEV